MTDIEKRTAIAKKRLAVDAVAKTLRQTAQPHPQQKKAGRTANPIRMPAITKRRTYAKRRQHPQPIRKHGGINPLQTANHQCRRAGTRRFDTLRNGTAAAPVLSVHFSAFHFSAICHIIRNTVRTTSVRLRESARRPDSFAPIAAGAAKRMNNQENDRQGPDWREEISRNITTIDALKKHLPLNGEEEDALRQVTRLHPLNIPRYYLSLIDPNDPKDPIRRLSVPTADELIVAGDMGETTQDPYADDSHDQGNGVLHKYGCSALVMTTESCAMYCRHCFRKRLVGKKAGKSDFTAALRYIADHPEIDNVILSGGDPLMLPTKTLRKLLTALADIKHLDYVRVGTRIPVTFPQRLQDDELLDGFRAFSEKKALYVATHFCHRREITAAAGDGVRRLLRTGAAINNQAVLLRGVNDSSDELVKLMNGLLRIGVNPYYLYQCMPVSRVRHHFQLPLKQGVAIVDKARAALNGYGKRFKFIIGHAIGKLEICGMLDDKLVLKQLHERIGHPGQASRILLLPINDNDGWVEPDDS